MRVLQIIIGLAIMAGLATAAMFAYRQYLAPEPTATAAVSAGDADQVTVIAAEGRVEPVRQARLAYRGGGRVRAVLVSEGERVEAGQALVQLADGELLSQRAQAQAALAAAVAQEALLPGDASAAQQDLAQAQIDQAEAALALAAAAVDEATLRAPFAGTLVSIAVEEGEVIGAGQPVVVLADLTAWRVVTVDVREDDAVAFQLGQGVGVTFAALPDAVAVTGIVSAIDLDASDYQGDVTYAVTIDLDRAPADLAWGMTAFVELDPAQPLVVAPPVASPEVSPEPPMTRRATLTAPAPTATNRAAASATPMVTRTPAPTCTPVATATAEVAEYIVQRGDNLSAIAERFGVTVQDIVRTNGLRSTTIVTGQRLVLPRP
jgi:RND family efflux transporter MFP subunit